MKRTNTFFAILKTLSFVLCISTLTAQNLLTHLENDATTKIAHFLEHKHEQHHHFHAHQHHLPENTSLIKVIEQDESVQVCLRFPQEFLENELNNDIHDQLLESIVGILHEKKYKHIALMTENEAGELVQLSDFIEKMPHTLPEKLENSDPFPDIKGTPALRGANPQIGQSQATGGLSGKTVWLSAGHGWLYYTSIDGFTTQRGNTNEMVEDFGSIEAVNYYLMRYLYNAGANVWTVRERDMNTNEVIVDNDDGSPTYTETGSWATSSSTGYNGGTYNYVNSETTETATAIYRPNIPESGYYWVSVQYRNGTNRPADTKYIVNHAGGQTAVSVNQEVHGLTWVYIGQFYFEAGTTASVVLSNESSETGQAVIADAVRFGGGMGTQLDCGYPAEGTSGRPRFEEAARYYAPYQGYPNCVGDVTTRPLYSEWELAKGTAEEQNNACYLAWHTNAGGGQGTSSFIHDTAPTTNSDLLQDFVHAELVNDIKSCWDSGWTDRGQKTANFGELRELSTMPGVLLEVAFHDLAADAQQLTTPDFRELAARAIYQGIVKYFANQDGVTPQILPEPPTHIAAKNDGNGNITVSWQAPITECGVGTSPTDYKVYMSTHGKGFADGIAVNGTSHTFSNLQAGTTYYFKVSATNAGGESFPTATVAARTPQSANNGLHYLIVDGFDRLDRSGAVMQYESSALGTVRRLFLERMNSYDYAVEHAKSLETCNCMYFDGASNEAVIDASVSLFDYDGVDWYLGEESTVDRTFDFTEQVLIETYLDNGGHLIVSGAEIGWDIGRSSGGNSSVPFYNNYLKAAYAGDDAGTYNVAGTGIFNGIATSFDDGTNEYNTAYPDRLSATGGSTVVMNYNGGTGDGAATAYNGSFGVVNFGFPLETVTDEAARAEILCNSVAFLTPFSGSCNGTLVKAKLWLQGADDGALMRTDLNTNNLLPLNQPYNTAPWNYAGNENVASSADFPTNTVDWVLLEVRDANDYNNIVETKAALLLNDGTLADVNNNNEGVFFSSLTDGNTYFLSVRHRNHLDVLAAIATALPNTTTYDFTQTANVLDGNLQTIDLNGKAALWAGDFDGDNNITTKDFNLYQMQMNNTTTYSASDTDCNGSVTNDDFMFYLENASRFSKGAMR